MPVPETYDITNLIGNQEQFAPLADKLVGLIYRTVMPEGWLAMGGLGTIRPFFNQNTKKWFIVVYSEVSRVDMLKVLDALKA